MADDKTVDQSPPETGSTSTDDKQSEPSLEDLQTQITELTKKNEEVSRRLSGKDKAYTALQKEKDELAKKQMTDEQKLQAELEADRKVLVDETKSLYVENLELTEDTASLIEGATAQEVKEKSATLKAYKSAVTAEKDTEIAALKKEIDVLKGEMPNPGGNNKRSGGLSDMSGTQLNDYVLKNPDQKANVLAEIRRRNAEPPK